MIEKMTGGFDMICDTCSEYEYIEIDDFIDMLIEARRRGWKIKNRKSGGWIHTCPVCAKEEKK